MQKVSAVLITLNAGDRLEATLNALTWCNEIVVVDSGSTDETLEICERYHCQIVHRDFDRYGNQKRFAVELAQHDWVLSVDSDEVVSERLKNEIQAVLRQPEVVHAGYYVSIPLIFLGTRIKSEASKKFLRFFNKRYGNFDDALVHEKVRLTGSLGSLKGEMLHYSYQDLTCYFRKFNRYTSLAAESLYQKRKSTSFAHIILKCPATFIKVYLLKGCILNGIPGFLWAFLSSVYPVVKYAKLWELNRQQPQVLLNPIQKQLLVEEKEI